MMVYNASDLPRISKSLKFSFFLNKIPFIRRFVIKFIRKGIGLNDDTSFDAGFYVSASLMSVGENVSLSDTFILAYAPVIIGNNVAFSFRNMIITSTHDYYDFNKVIVKSVTIGDNVWITSNVIILPGVTIGENSIIGAGSVVTHSIPPYVYAAGNPCKVIKYLK